LATTPKAEPQDAVLIKWVDDLINAAEEAFVPANVRVVSRVRRAKSIADVAISDITYQVGRKYQ